MTTKRCFIFQEIPPFHPGVSTLIALSMGFPTSEKITQVLSLYGTPGYRLVGCFEVNELIALIGLEIREAKGIIRHIAVLSECRLQGIGKALTKYVREQFSLQTICAETDDEAVEFYRKIGFICQPFKENNRKRYKCWYSS